MRSALWLACLCLALAGCNTPQPFELDSSQPLVEAQAPFKAGFAERAFTPGKGYPLGGFGGGARRQETPLWWGLGWFGRLSVAAHMAWNEEGQGRETDFLVPAQGTLDDLTARALVLRPEGRAPVALVRIDAIGTTADVHTLVAAAVADLGYRPDTVLIASTHTHSGMGGYIRAPLGCVIAMDNFRPELEERLVRACADAIRAAHQSARPAALGFGRARDRDAEGRPVLAKNRRSRHFPGEIARDAIDDEVGLILVEATEDDSPIALVVNYAVHGTVLGPDNLYFSEDVSGGVERALTKRLGGTPVVFINGAEGDIAPSRITTRGGPKRIRELGEAFADLVAPAVAEIQTSARIDIASAQGEKELGSPFAQIALARGRFIDGEEGIGPWLTWPLALPVNVILWSLGFHYARFAITWNGALGLVIDISAYVDRTRARFGGLRIVAGAEDAALLTIPGEATHDVGLALREEIARRGATRSFVLGLAQDHIMYIASREEYRRGGYEAASTLFGQDTATQVAQAHAAILDALGYEAPSPAAGED